MNKLEKINELVKKIKLYGSDISDIYENVDINLEDNYMEDGEIFISLEIDKLSIGFKIDIAGRFYIELSEDSYEELDEVAFWQTMYFKLRR